MPVIHRPTNRPRPIFDLLSRLDDRAVMPAVIRPTDYLIRQCLPQIFFFLTFVLTTLPTLGGPRGGDLTNGSGRSLFKSGERELGDNRVLGGTTKNERPLAIRSTSPGRAIWQQNCRTVYMYQPPDVRTSAVRPEFFFLTTCCSACSYPVDPYCSACSNNLE